MPNRAPEKWGMLQVYTGNGKGKTTAALGTALRAFAKGKRVAMVYFDKGGTHYSERGLLDWFKEQSFPGGGALTYIATGLDRIDPESGRFRFGVTDEDRAEATRGLIAAKAFLVDGYDVVVLDEFNTSLGLAMISEADGRAVIDMKPKNVECICTGRNAPAWLIEKADLVTDMTIVKHYFYHGEAARDGLDY
jgi:cob(I)alamin adenosyltransferase